MSADKTQAQITEFIIDILKELFRI